MQPLVLCTVSHLLLASTFIPLCTKGLDGSNTPERLAEAEENGLERGTKWAERVAGEWERERGQGNVADTVRTVSAHER